MTEAVHGPDPTSEATAAWSAYRSRRHFASLDGIRCLSILAVMWHHSPHAAAAPWNRGFLGVDLFFVLSGFLITTLLLREHDRNGRISLRDFYMRRTLRIFPLYYAFLLAQMLGLFVLKRGSDLADGVFRVAPYYLTYTTNWAPVEEDLFHHSWSLAVEEQFYLLWPPLLVLLGVRRAVVLLFAFLAAAQAFDFGLFDGLDPGRWWAVRLAPFSAIALGVLLGIGLHGASGFRVAYAAARQRWFVVLPVLALFGLVQVDGDIGGPVRLAIHLSMVLLLTSVLVNEDHFGARLLRCRPVVHIGVISYGMYLLHMVCLIAGERILQRLGTQHVLAFFCLGTLLTVAAASVSYATIERFFLDLKRRFRA